MPCLPSLCPPLLPALVQATIQVLGADLMVAGLEKDAADLLMQRERKKGGWRGPRPGGFMELGPQWVGSCLAGPGEKFKPLPASACGACKRIGAPGRRQRAWPRLPGPVRTVPACMPLAAGNDHVACACCAQQCSALAARVTAGLAPRPPCPCRRDAAVC